MISDVEEIKDDEEKSPLVNGNSKDSPDKEDKSDEKEQSKENSEDFIIPEGMY